MITVNDNTINVHFDHWDTEAYKTFLQSKHLPEYNLEYDYLTDSYTLKTPARFAHIFGLDDIVVDHGFLPTADYLFDYEKFIVRIALEAKRYAIWADTGLGKTAMFLEFARQVRHRTDGKVLLIVPLNIIQQTIDEAAKFYGGAVQLELIKSRDILKTWCTDGRPGTAIVNPEKFIPRNNEPEVISEIRYCAGVILDEASILKAGGGTIKWSLIKSCRGIEYKLSCTATPAPNDTMEYASQGNFLEKLRNEGDILWTYFTRDKEGNWKVKKHAENAFYAFMSGWSVYLRNPVHYGFADNLKDLPPPVIKQYELDITPEQRAMILAVPDTKGQYQIFGNDQKMGITERIKYSQIAKGFMYRPGQTTVRINSIKPGFVAELIKTEVGTGVQVIVWTVFDEESNILGELLAGSDFTVDILTGKIPKTKRVPIIERFRKGKSRVLISKASLLGFGLNFQNCGAMVFSGFNDSFEQFYQAVWRAYRYGQTKAVRVHIPFIRELEGIIWNNIMNKQEKFERDTAQMEANYLEAMKGVLGLEHGNNLQ